MLSGHSSWLLLGVLELGGGWPALALLICSEHLVLHPPLLAGVTLGVEAGSRVLLAVLGWADWATAKSQLGFPFPRLLVREQEFPSSLPPAFNPPPLPAFFSPTSVGSSGWHSSVGPSQRHTGSEKEPRALTSGLQILRHPPVSTPPLTPSRFMILSRQSQLSCL